MSFLRVIAVLVLAGAGVAAGADLPLRIDLLGEPLKVLTAADRAVVEDAVKLVEQGRHGQALDRLMALTKSHPDNSSLRILAGWAALQAGNLSMALDSALKAHEAPNGNEYKCWFLAKVALLTGDRATCEREFKHFHKAPGLKAEARELKKAMAK
ncbi:MAG: hypothetical protein SFV54_00145 [Bryobacteraceae bacterium]|nr:hypothetical protein [Bryobacteraceae bacterium]